ncbi:adenylate/guanylate cyclase domain-containing protein [Ilumatobacter sp.]|uniref:adenylate/guanylate cyclase domain-containing protein n=1 Tax=Ilumatobacter sp. TaxID=1967498 RepID=UPI003C44B320
MRETLRTIGEWPGRIVRNTSVATRLSLVVLLVALVSLVIAAVVGLQRAGQISDTVVRARIESLGAARADEVERYIVNLERAAISQAISPSTAQAIDDFTAAYEVLDAEPPTAEDEQKVNEYYVDVVAPELSEVRDRPVSAARLAPKTPAAIRLQAKYVVPGDETGLLADAGDGSEWSEVHASLDQAFGEFAIQTGVDDVYLIEPEGRTIVYSTAKDIDFATSLLFGPQSGSALAVLINSFGEQPEPGTAMIRDFTTYSGAGDEPSLFVASPVVGDGSVAGFVAMRIGPDRISAITTNGGMWDEQDTTGETYAVAGDNLMRSDARGFIEDESAFVDGVLEAGTATERETQLMEMFETTVLFQPVADQAVDAALDDPPSVVETNNFLGIEVLQARRSLDIEGLDWAIFTEFDRSEIEQPSADFSRNLLIAIGLFLVAITFLAGRWAGSIVLPVRIISTRLRAIRAGGEIGEGVSSELLPSGSSSEFVELATDIDTMLETLAGRNAAASDRASERRRLLRRILPPQVAQRAEAGDRDVVEQIAHATVAVVVIRGLGRLMHDDAGEEARDLLDRFVEEADALAKRRGVERIRLTGDAYFATCGTVRPHIDHGARAVLFALDVRDLIDDLIGDEDRGLSMSVGIDSGPITIGLTGGSGLVYDAWGTTLQSAADLARRAGPGEVLVSATSRALLPSNLVVEDLIGPNVAPGTVLVSGRASDEATVT